MIKFLTLKSIRNRKFTTSLCIISIALSLSLFLIVEKLRVGIEEGFTNSISNADLIVGARSGPLQLLLYSVFHLGSPTNNITIDTYNKIKELPSIEWTIPISLGDSYKGHRVVSTNENFFKHYQFFGDKKLSIGEGVWGTGVFDVVLGSQVASKLSHNLGDSITLSHGISENSILRHKKTPFRVVGILNSTGTPVDKSVYITLFGMEAVHVGWSSGLPNYEEIDKSKYLKENLKTQQITSFILRTRNRISLLRLQRYIATYDTEALSAIIPAMTLAELWRMLDQFEIVLLGISLFAILIGFLSVLISLYMSLNNRQREMAILRSIGVSARKITFLLLAEASLLSFIGAIFGFVFQYGLIFIIYPILENKYAVHIPFSAPSSRELTIVSMFIVFGTFFGLVPAIKAYKMSLSDGLLIK